MPNGKELVGCIGLIVLFAKNGKFKYQREPKESQG